MQVVDVHCHTFNADDIPVRGFVQRVLVHNVAVLRLVSKALDALGQGMAPGYWAESEELGRLLRVSPSAQETRSDVEPDPDAEAYALLTLLQESDPDLVSEAESELAVEAGEEPEAMSERELLGIGRALLPIKWVVLMGRSRLRITRTLMETYAGVDLFVSMLVDLEAGLHDRSPVTVREQLELHEKISRLSMLERIAPRASSRVHLFVGFDPRRELAARKAGEVKTALDLLGEAIDDYGFIGVKVYPPMGFRPAGNQATREMTKRDAELVDDVLDEFYTWCEQHHVPVTAHCNPSNEALDEYRDFSSPENWRRVLAGHPKLRLNLGHFGGLQVRSDSGGWPEQIASLAEQYEHLYVDTGNHRTDRAADLDAYLAVLSNLFSNPRFSHIQQRLMFGTDWYMNALHPKYDAFLNEYRTRYRGLFGEEAEQRFMGDAALEFLGFDKPKNLNNRRLRARYAKYAPAAVPAWLAREG